MNKPQLIDAIAKKGNISKVEAKQARTTPYLTLLMALVAVVSARFSVA